MRRVKTDILILGAGGAGLFAALHANAEYRAAAVLAPGADYRADAARILRDRAPHALAAEVADAALYGIALRELISLR